MGTELILGIGIRPIPEKKIGKILDTGEKKITNANQMNQILLQVKIIWISGNWKCLYMKRIEWFSSLGLIACSCFKEKNLIGINQLIQVSVSYQTIFINNSTIIIQKTTDGL